MVVGFEAPAGRAAYAGTFQKSQSFQELVSAVGLASALDPLKARSYPALKQRPVEAERQRQIAAVDHLIGLFGGARHPADWDAAFEDAFFGARHQRLHLRIIDTAALVDGGCEVAGPDHREVDAWGRHDLVDALDRFDMLDGDHAD